MPPQSVVVEVFFVRVPFGDARANAAVWSEADEQRFAPQLRERWAQNGFRIGLLGGQLPGALVQLMDLKDAPQPQANSFEANPVDLQSEPRVVKRHLQIRPEQPSEVLASGVYDEWPVLVSEHGQVSGQTYRHAQGSFSLQVTPERDGRVKIQLRPQLSYGEMRQRFVGSEGTFRLEAGQPKRYFNELAATAVLAPGQLLILSCLPKRSGSLGHYFFTDTQHGALEQKLLLVRLGQTQHNDLVCPQDVLSLDPSSASK